MPESDADKFSDASDALQINEEIAEIRKVKFPEFWKSRPALWFAQIEAQFLVHNIRSDQTKFNKLVCELDYSILEQVADIIESPPEKDRYNTIKTRLIKQFTESEGKRLRKLLNDVELGDQRPSGLLRKMKLLAGDKVGSELLQSIWMQRLPENIRAILASMDSTDNDKLAEIADKILDAREPQIESVQQLSTNTFNDLNSLKEEIRSLRAEIQNLKRDRSSQFHESRNRNRSSSQSRQKSRSATRNFPQICRYHRKFGAAAIKCIKPCTYTNPEN